MSEPKENVNLNKTTFLCGEGDRAICPSGTNHIKVIVPPGGNCIYLPCAMPASIHSLPGKTKANPHSRSGHPTARCPGEVQKSIIGCVPGPKEETLKWKSKQLMSNRQVKMTGMLRHLSLVSH